MREKECYFSVEDGKFSLWDDPQPGRTPLMMREDEQGRITAEDQGGCAHFHMTEGVSEDGCSLAEPPFDQCVDCGATFY